MSPIDTGRVAEIIVRNGPRTEYGSGYRISSRLILTVAHLLGDSGNPTCTVLLGGADSELPATPVWLGAGQDLALLRLDSVGEAGSLDGVAPVALGCLPDGVGSVPFTGVGFPAYAQRPNSSERRGLQRRDSRQVNGFVQLGSNMKSGLLDLTFTTSAPAEKGPDGQDAWQGISGTALFALTRDGSLLVGVQAHRLPAAGTGSAEAEPIVVALKDPEFARLLALNGVRPQAVAIDPPGHDPTSLLQAVIPQQKLIEGFGDFKKNLTPERLPFVSPGTDHPAEPQNLFVQLVTSADRGVLLVGAAGTGKSRTGIEVGRLALEAGWRVLHVLPGEDDGITDQIAEQVLATPSAVLVVVDYLNESQLDLPALRHRLIPEAHRRGIHVALLACVRPGWLKKADRALLHELFDEVELRQDHEFQRLVTDNALTTLAPTAIRQLGMPRMLAVCGHRPIVALLVAREIERRVVAGLTVPETAGLRSGGELSAWLESRLSEDGLTIAGREDTFTPARASHGLVAAAAATAACPQSRVEVTAAAHAALARATGPVPQAEDVVATLVSLGWLELDNGVLSVAHDIVADQFVESVMIPEREGTPDITGAHAMLAGCLTSPRTIGRFAVNVGRVVTDMALGDRAPLVLPVLDDWFTENAEDIGRVLRRDSDLGSYALGAICSGPPWSASASGHWQQVVAPWLTDFGTGANARHLLYRGLRHLPGDVALRLLPTALAWLKVHGRTRKAGYVLSRLLSRTDLPAQAVRQAVTVTLTWLDDHATTPEAQFVLNPLLAHTDLTPDNAQQAISTALTWLDNHATTPEAQFVLNPLLAHTDLTPDNAQQAISTALTWLDNHATTTEASFVLRPLLAHTDLSPDNAQQAISKTLTWLDNHATTTEAQFVLDPLLARTDLTPDNAQQAISKTLTWLDNHATTTEARFVLNPLLARTDLTPDNAQQAISKTLTWLDNHATTTEAGFVLRPLLARTDLIPDSAQQAISKTLTWLDNHATTTEAQFVLNPLLARTDLTPDNAQQAISTALTWLDNHATTTEADFVIGALLKRLPAEEIPSAMTGVVETWISKHVPEQDFTYLSKWVLRKQLMSQVIFDALLEWARTNPDNEDLIFRMASAGFQVGPYLTSRESILKWLCTVELCLDHAERRGPAANLNGALDTLIGTLTRHFRTGVGAAWADDCIQRWLGLEFSMNPSVFRPHNEVIHRCHAMALSGRLDAAQWGSIAKRLRDWVVQWPQHESKDRSLEFIKYHLSTIEGSNP